MNFKNTILLTGAGFTANFGGFLAKEMWSKIFNNPKLENAGNLKLALRKDFDYEDVYSQVFDGRTLPEHEVKIFEEILNEAYLAMDDVIKQPFSDSGGIHPGSVQKFLDYFRTTTENQVGGCFTLNQDLFMERNFGWQSLGPIQMRFQGTFGTIDPNDINSDSQKTLPTQEELEIYKSSFSENFCYVKLHGSLRWVAAGGKDSKVLGINKMNTIDRIPLLKWYFELFQQALYRNNVKLVVIGYGFKDAHINDCISKAASEFGLKIYIISPENPDLFNFRITHKYPPSVMVNEDDIIGQRIWNGIAGYFPYTLRRVFPYPERFTAESAELKKALGISF